MRALRNGTWALLMATALLLAVPIGLLPPSQPASAASIEDLLAQSHAKVEALIARGDFKAASAASKQLVARARKRLQPDDARLVVYLAELAGLYDRLGKAAEAQATLDQAITLLDHGTKDSPVLSPALAELARLLAASGKPERAEVMVSRALAIAEDATGPDSPEVAGLRRQLADIFVQRGKVLEASIVRNSLTALSNAGSGVVQTGQGNKNVAADGEEMTRQPSAAESAQPPSPELDSGEQGGASQSEKSPAPKIAAAPPKPAPIPDVQPTAPALRKKGGSRHRSILAAPPPSAAAPQPSIAAAAAAEYHVVPVFYGTNRKSSEGISGVAFSSTESDALTFGMAMITVPTIHQVPQVERPWSLRVPGTDVEVTFETQDPAKHFTIKSIENLPQDQFIARAKSQLGQSQAYKGQALVFVHGFYNKFDDALYRTAQIAYDLQFDGATFMFSWPSAGTVDAYWTDRPKAENAGAKLRAFLTLVAEKTGATKVSVIAHSMGNLPLMEALDESITLDNQPSPVAAIDEIVLAAPDVGREEFTKLAQHMSHVRGGITLYAASNDLALEASRAVNHEARAGDIGTDGPLMVPRVDTIDATRASTQMFRLNHYYVAESSAILCDVEHILRGGVRPPSARSKILMSVQAVAGTYFAYRP